MGVGRTGGLDAIPLRQPLEGQLVGVVGQLAHGHPGGIGQDAVELPPGEAGLVAVGEDEVPDAVPPRPLQVLQGLEQPPGGLLQLGPLGVGQDVSALLEHRAGEAVQKGILQGALRLPGPGQGHRVGPGQKGVQSPAAGGREQKGRKGHLLSIHAEHVGYSPLRLPAGDGGGHKEGVGVVNRHGNGPVVPGEQVPHGDNPVDLGQHHRQRVDVKAHDTGENQRVFLGGPALGRNIVLPPDGLYGLDEKHPGAAAHVQHTGRILPQPGQGAPGHGPGNPMGGELLPQHEAVLPVGQLGEQLAKNVLVADVGEVVGGQTALHSGHELHQLPPVGVVVQPAEIVVVHQIKIQFSRCALRSWICDYNSNKIVQFIGQKFWYAA